MINTIEEMIKKYEPVTIEETKNSIREIMQSIVLIGLSRSDFFKKASFYGGTALRIFYGLNRFSEDLDFTLNEKDENFTIEPYIKQIEDVAESFGLYFEITTKTKAIKTPIESAFAKLNTYQTFISLSVNSKLTSKLHKDEVIKVKFEIDCNPPLGFNTQTKWIDLPEFAPVVILDESSLFSGKIHAILCRNYKNTVKGRDYYDFLYYIAMKVRPNMIYLRNKLIESNTIDQDDEFNINILKKMLTERIEKVNFVDVQNDVSRFILKPENISYYSKDFFMQMVEKIQLD